MRLIAVGCEYAGVTTLIDGLYDWETNGASTTISTTTSPYRTRTTSTKRSSRDSSTCCRPSRSGSSGSRSCTTSG